MQNLKQIWLMLWNEFFAFNMLKIVIFHVWYYVYISYGIKIIWQQAFINLLYKNLSSPVFIIFLWKQVS